MTSHTLYDVSNLHMWAHVLDYVCRKGCTCGLRVPGSQRLYRDRASHMLATGEAGAASHPMQGVFRFSNLGSPMDIMPIGCDV